MTRTRIDGLCLLFLGATIVLFLMIFLARARSSGALEDFIAEYYSSRTLLHHEDPYNEAAVLRRYQVEGGDRPLNDAQERAIATRFVYPPSAFVVMVPFALLPWGPAHLLWMFASCGTLIFASLLAWDLAADFAPVAAGALIGFLLANSEVVVVLGNPSSLAIGLCVIAVWCFLRNRFALMGAICMALSLAVKPQDAGLVWLYFLLASPIFRKHAWRALGVLLACSVAMVAWVSVVAPHWFQEMQANLAAFSVRGGLNDPGPSSNLAHDLVDLQVVMSRFWDNPHFYNLASLLIFVPLLIVWIMATIRARGTENEALLALASIATLTLLPVHHHLYDTKLLLLMTPAVCMLWAKGGVMGRTALGIGMLAYFVAGDLSNTLMLRGVFALPLGSNGSGGWLKSALMVFPVPLVLLGTGAFFLATYRRGASNPESAA